MEDPMSRLQRFLTAFLLFALTACSQRLVVTFEELSPATSTPEVVPMYENPTLVPTLPPWDPTPTQIPTVTPDPLVIARPTDFSPVLYGGKWYQSTFFLLLGGVSRDGWLSPQESAARFSGEATYSLHSMVYLAKYFLWGRVPEYSPAYQVYTIGTDTMLDEGGMVATLDGWSVAKWPADELSPDNADYRQAVLDWLAKQGVTDPQLGSLQIFRTDLENDGSDEIFLAATRLDDSQHTTKAGDYSVVLMRKLIGGEVMTIPLVADVYSSREAEITFPRTYSLANFIDLNQDGRLEVVVDFRKWEGFGAAVFQINGQTVIQVLMTES
jgi:hypothetical protein